MSKLSGILTVSIFLSAAPTFAATVPQFSVGLGVEYGKGNFQTGYDNTITSFPLVLDWFPNERFNLEVNVPYLKQTVSRPSNPTNGTMTTGTMPSGSGNMPVVTPHALAATQGMMSGSGSGVMLPSGENQSGLGDITLTGAYNVLVDSETTPNFGVTCYLKFPTADKDKGLGTGAFDWGPGVSLSKRLGNWQPFSEGRYVLQGSSRPETGARNYFLADLGTGYGWRENLTSSLFCRLGSSPFAGLAAPLEMRLKTVWGYGENTSVEFYLLKGLSHGSPDLGGGLSFFVDF